MRKILPFYVLSKKLNRKEFSTTIIVSVVQMALKQNTGLFKMTVGVLTNCHTHYT